jgi:hypothetical protein
MMPTWTFFGSASCCQVHASLPRLLAHSLSYSSLVCIDVGAEDDDTAAQHFREQIQVGVCFCAAVTLQP